MKIIRSERVKYSKNTHNKNFNKSCESTNIILNESNFYNEDISDSINKSFTPPKTKPELVTVKLFPSPKKCKISYVEMNNSEDSQIFKEKVFLTEKMEEKQNQIAIELTDKDFHQNSDGAKKKIINIKFTLTKTKTSEEKGEETADFAEYVQNNDFFPHENCGNQNEIQNYSDDTSNLLRRIDSYFQDNTEKIIETTDLDNLEEVSVPRVPSSMIQTTDLDNFSMKSELPDELKCPNNSGTEIEIPLNGSSNILQCIDDYFSKYSNKSVQTTDLDDFTESPPEENDCIFEENKERPLSPIQNFDNNKLQEEEQNPLHSTQHDFSSMENETGKSSLIFLPNKNRPLSPISNLKSPSIFPKVQHLISFHENAANLSSGTQVQDCNRRHSLPIMGRARLMEKIECTDQSKLNDSEIIHDLVHDRFIVNAYKNRSFKKPPKKPARFGKIYRSLERRLRTQDERNKMSKTVHADMFHQSSTPLKDSFMLETPNMTKEDNYSRISEGSEKSSTESTSTDDVPVIESVKLKKEEVEPTPSQNSSNLNLNRYSTSTVFEEMPERDQNISYSAFGSEYASASQFSENYCNSTDDFSSFSGYLTPGTFKNFDLASERKKEESKPDINEEKAKEETPLKESRENTLGNEMSYDMDEFLKKALGDDFNEVSSFMAQDERKQPSIQALNEDSVCTSDASDLLSKINTFRSSFYKSLTRRLKSINGTMHSASTVKEDNKSSSDISSFLPNTPQVEELLRQASLQYEAMQQLSKALTLCRNTKEFTSSEEQIEAERLLLLAKHRREAIIEEIRNIDYEQVDPTPSQVTGSIVLSDITFPLKRTIDKDYKRHHDQWFVCLVTNGTTVISTKCVLARNLNYVEFEEEITCHHLPSNFTITIEVYSLLQKRSSRNFSHESKFHLNKELKSSTCPVPKYNMNKDKSLQKTLSRANTGIHASSFRLNGVLRLKVADITKKEQFKLQKVPLSSSLQGFVSIKMKSQVKILVKHSGFMTVGTNLHGSYIWNRRWCLLQGNIMYFWNYPCNIEDSIDPLETIDLRRCMNNEVQPVDREICSKPRTLLLETIETDSQNFEKHFFNFDNLSDMKQWETQLNKVVSILRTWNDSYLR